MIGFSHTHICGTTRTKSFQGDHYFMFLIDDFTRITWVTLLKHKSKEFQKFKDFKELVENEIDFEIKCLRSDKGVEYTSNKFNEFVRDMEQRDTF